MHNYVISLIAVSILIVLDIISGLLAALKTGNFSSSRMREGLISKTGEIFAEGLMILIEAGLPKLGIIANIPFVTFMTLYLVIMEVGSCIENLGKINPQLAKPLSKIFKQLKDVTGQEEDDEDNQRNSA